MSSLICSALRELIEAGLKTRALDLERAVRELLADPDGTGMTRDVFNHPIVAGLFVGKYDPASLRPKEDGPPLAKLPFSGRRHLPSYIPSGQFVAALVDVVVRGNGEDVPYARPRPKGPIDLARLRAEVERFDNPAVRRALQVATDGAVTFDEATRRMEAWFNGSMDRASGWYKRRTQWMLFAIGLATALVMNIDSVTVTRRLLDDDDLRAAAVRAAEVRAPPLSPSVSGTPSAPAGLAGTADTVQALRTELTNIGFPMGWSLQSGGLFPDAQARRCPAAKPAATRPPGAAGSPHAVAPACDGALVQVVAGKPVAAVSGGDLILMPIGWLITALAITMGAPFWFDMLSKFIIVRATVKPSQKSQDEASPERTLNTSPAGGDMVAGDVAGDAWRTAPAGAVQATPPATPVQPLILNRWAIGNDPDEGLL
ncbi:hypothetical protein [Novosphingobium sp. AP12]|uniref:hypothetical protein n=1 Tax=Novosphingobium sp. AP12 TaxID=1144305 RepID=UPI00138AD7A8|nr:hypothetical protein [Novosphingobium sp. AP12]